MGRICPWNEQSDTWWRHQMETFSALLVFCAGNSPVTGEFPSQRQVTRSFDVFLELHPNKRLSKESWGWWFETPSSSLWRHCNDEPDVIYIYLYMRLCKEPRKCHITRILMRKITCDRLLLGPANYMWLQVSDCLSLWLLCLYIIYQSGMNSWRIILSYVKLIM